MNEESEDEQTQNGEDGPYERPSDVDLRMLNESAKEIDPIIKDAVRNQVQISERDGESPVEGKDDHLAEIANTLHSMVEKDTKNLLLKHKILPEPTHALLCNKDRSAVFLSAEKEGARLEVRHIDRLDKLLAED